VDDFWGIFWLAVVMKVPIAALLWLVFWAIRSVPETAGDERGDGGQRIDQGPRDRPPRPPRRGPHRERPPVAPERTRVSRGRQLVR
jgi:hypothetical protein